ncbi:MAG: hypothetical protein QOK21_2173 [Solirubrobacteraceae bacterium]|nr:hypothetical protein [Solirubrobacteraceae bacterium]
MLGDANTSSTNSAVTAVPASSACTGVLKRWWTAAIQRDAGSAPSRAQEKASRLPAPWIEVPHEKKAKMISSSRKSCIPLESRPRMNGTPPPLTVAPTALCAGIASSSAAVRISDAMPPQISARRIARGTWRPASSVSSEMSPADSKP